MQRSNKHMHAHVTFTCDSEYNPPPDDDDASLSVSRDLLNSLICMNSQLQRKDAVLCSGLAPAISEAPTDEYRYRYMTVQVHDRTGT